MLIVKHEPELQHVFGHIMAAIDHLSNNKPGAARVEMKSIESIVLYNCAADMEIADGEMQHEEAP